jgi:hypothetical protein
VSRRTARRPRFRYADGMVRPLMTIVRPCVLGLVGLLLGAAVADASPEWAAPAPTQVTQVTGVGPVSAARKGKKRRRLRRKRIKPTRFQNVTPHQHLGPGISR